MVKFEYVASGLSFLRVNYSDTWSGDICDKLNGILSNLRGKHNHEFSFLYNAYTEKHLGEPFKNSFSGKGIKQVYADSGGLQMVTLGKKIKQPLQQLRQEVYESQAKYSHMALSFDEMPITITSNDGRSRVLDTENRHFDRNIFEHCARQSGKNIKEQIETFIKHGSGAKPVFIVQGADCDTFVKWVELGLEEIPQELHEFIGGVALSGGGIGHDTLQDCKRAFYYTQLPLFGKVNHLHLLGVGSLRRLIPYLSFVSSGVYKDITISYDSTTHTSGVQMGRYYDRHGKWINPGRHFGIDYVKINEDIKFNLPDYKIDDEQFCEDMNLSVRKYEKKYGSINPPIIAFNSFFVSTVMNFIRHVDSVVQDYNEIYNWMGENQATALNALRSIKTVDDFTRWTHGPGACLPSAPVRDGAPPTLPEFA